MSGTEKRSCWLRMLAAGVLFVGAASPAWAGDAAGPGLDQGKQLFERQFAAERLASGGDGLGPVFNNVSCASCHLQGGLGGAGPIDVNAVILSATLGGGQRPSRSALLLALKEAHPGFVTADDKIVPNV